MSKTLLIKILLVTLALEIIAAVVIAVVTYGGVASSAKTCANNRQIIEAAALQYKNTVTSSKKSFPLNLDAVVAAGIISKLPVCPSGGKYYWSPIDGRVYCDIKGHQ